jgi:hypothetical protein
MTAKMTDTLRQHATAAEATAADRQHRADTTTDPVLAARENGNAAFMQAIARAIRAETV